MSQWIKLALAVATVTVALVESRVIPAEPVSVMMDAYGNPVMFLREKRSPVRPYPQQAMMFTSYYRPVRRSSSQASGVFAQGNAVSGQAFFDMQSPLMNNGPQPIEEPEVSSAEAQASPGVEENFRDHEEEEAQEPESYQPQGDHRDDAHHHYDDGHHHQHEYHGNHPHHEDEHHQHHQHDEHHPNAQPAQDEEPEPVPVFTTEAAAATPVEEPASSSNTEATVSGTKKVKKTRKPVVMIEDDDEDDEADDDEPTVPFVPMKGNRRRQGYPNLNNFFPMVFSFPGVSSRAGAGSGSPPGAITAIANSYSTGKGGVANSVATAYGGAPPAKKKRMPQSEE